VSEDRLDYAVLISLATREEAEVAAAALRADGVDAFVGNANHAGMQWLYVLALGGLQILVPRRKLADAKALLRERIKENAEVGLDEPARRSDRWKLWAMLLVFPGFLSWELYYLVDTILYVLQL
jgi:hypothetical protein